MRISDWSSDVCSSDLKTRRLTSSEASEIDLNIADDGRRISFVRDQNLFAVSLADGREAQLPTDGQGTITCGTAEFVPTAAFGRTHGAWLSPPSGRHPFHGFDDTAVPVVTPNPTHSSHPRVEK